MCLAPGFVPTRQGRFKKNIEDFREAACRVGWIPQGFWRGCEVQMSAFEAACCFRFCFQLANAFIDVVTADANLCILLQCWFSVLRLTLHQETSLVQVPSSGCGAAQLVSGWLDLGASCPAMCYRSLEKRCACLYGACGCMRVSEVTNIF